LVSVPSDDSSEDGCVEPCKKRPKLCEMGTGEIVHIISYKALPSKIEEFECKAQSMANCLYHMQSGITDIRVCHPKCGEVIFVITFLSKRDQEMFQDGPQRDGEKAFEGLVEKGDKETMIQMTGCLMPAAHTLKSLLAYLKMNVIGSSHNEHDVRSIQKELSKWYPRPSEFEKYVHWDDKDPNKYTRNLIFSNVNMDVILMCWPPGSKSSIHDHDESSCWVVMVEGSIVEVQYGMPQVDRKFIETEMRNPSGAVGRCGKLRILNEAKLDPGGCTSSYANNDIGIHRVENRTTRPAYTLHVYAPPLQKMKIFKETGEVSVHTVQRCPFTSIDGERCIDNEGIVGKRKAADIDVEAWNGDQYFNQRSQTSI